MQSMTLAPQAFGRGQEGHFLMYSYIHNPFAPTNLKHQLEGCYCRNEMEKRRQYDERIHEVEHGSFAPQVFSTSGGISKQENVVYKHLASMLARKRDQPYSHVIGFSLLRSSITCLWGTRSAVGFVPNPTYPNHP